MSESRTAIFSQLLRVVFGLFICANGTYLIIQANLGLSPWEALSMGISYHTPLSFGTAHTLTALIILLLDVGMREKIGWGTVFDALLVGAFVDLLSATGLLPTQHHLLTGVPMLIAGVFVMALGQFFYMSAGHGCGPRDTFLMAVGRRMSRFPIGAVNVGILALALLGGWILGAPIGVGTVLSTFGLGTAMQIVFHFLHFEPRAVPQRGLLETVQRLAVHH